MKIWEASSGRELLTLRGHAGVVENLTFSPDGRRLASGAGDATVRIWDTATGQELLTLRGHTQTVGGVAFSKDGKLLASASAELKIWNAPGLGVSAVGSPGPASGTPDTTAAIAGSGGWWLLFGAVFVIGAVGAAFFVLRKRKPALAQLRPRARR